MIGAGTFINPLIKIVTTVAILAAIYFFFVKPSLDSGEEFSRGINETVNEQLDRSFKQSNDLQRSIQESIESSIPPSARRAQKRGECISRAGGDIGRIEACNEKFPP
jgi:hypothetical protein